MPKIQSKRPGEDAQMFCHVSGEPFPQVNIFKNPAKNNFFILHIEFQVKWLKNDEELKIDDNSKKYQMVGNGTSLRIKKIDFADTGAYMCQATNIGSV